MGSGIGGVAYFSLTRLGEQTQTQTSGTGAVWKGFERVDSARARRSM